MRINHNIASLNTYRQLNANSANGAKSLEKLSSGLRINKAGDDAAGLAISEKMRGQIRGLDQAARNSQDGISLIQTAEGALSETHSILQRMRELAVQGSNDTLTASDRDEVQNEMNQLTSEINRIGNTTEFNSKKLLNGTQATTSGGISKSGSALIGGAAGTANVAAAGATMSGGDDGEQGVYTFQVTTGMAGSTTNTVAFGGVTATIDTSGVAAAASTTDTTATVGLADAVQDETALATAIAAAFNANKARTGSTLSNYVFSSVGDTVTIRTAITADAESLTAELGNGYATVGAVKGGAGTLVLGATTTVTEAENSFQASQTFTFSGTPDEGTMLTIGDKTVAFYNDSTHLTNKTGDWDTDANAATSMGSDFAINTNGKALTEVMAELDNLDLAGNSDIISHTTNSVTVQSDVPGVAGNVYASTVTDPTAGDKAAGFVTLTQVPLDQTTVSIGDASIGFYDSSKHTGASWVNGAFAGTGAATAAATTMGVDIAIDISGKTLSQVLTSISTGNGAVAGALYLTAGGAENEAATRDVEITNVNTTSGRIDFRAITGGSAGNDVEIDTTGQAVGGSQMQIGANKAQSMLVDINDVRANAIGVSSTVGASSVIIDGSSYEVEFTATNAVTDGTSSTNTERALSVSDHSTAEKSIEVIDAAIRKVSGERSKLGSFQNRLEHTIANLGTSSENLTAAESRIRDVDMAKEMMEFTKNNILSQAAQSMLAQANQQPQGVLQLLR